MTFVPGVMVSPERFDCTQIEYDRRAAQGGHPGRDPNMWGPTARAIVLRSRTRKNPKEGMLVREIGRRPCPCPCPCPLRSRTHDEALQVQPRLDVGVGGVDEGAQGSRVEVG